MSENEIKPVAWCAVDDMRNEWAFAWGGTGRRPWHDSPLYDQSAIEALNNQISELKTMLSIAEFQRKEMQAERDAAVADAERYRWLRDLPEDHPSECIGNMPGYMWDSMIDEARAEDMA